MADDGLLVDIGDIRQRLQDLVAQEARHDDELSELLNGKESVECRIASLHRISPKLGKLHKQAQSLNDMVGKTCALAKNVSSKVRELDLIKGRLQETIERVEDVIGIRDCVNGVWEALKEDNYEEAAQHIHRYLSFDTSLLESEGQGSEYSEDGSTLSLQEAHEKVKNILHEKFDEAANSANEADVDKYFVLLPLVNQRAEGLEKYGRFLSYQLLQKQSNPASDQYASRIASLVESVAVTIKEKSPLIEKSCGKGNLLPVLQMIQSQCDSIGVQIVEAFIQKRELQTVVKEETTLTSRELDGLLSELAAIMQRAEIYFQFLRSHIASELEYLRNNADGTETPYGLNMLQGEFATRIQALTGDYLSLEQRSLNYSIKKALELNTREGNSKTSSLVDDTFFVISKSARRAMSTFSANCFCAMVNSICATIEQQYIKIFQDQLQPLWQSGLADLAAAAFSARRNTSEATLGDLMVTLNNLDKSAEFTRILHNELHRRSKELYKRSAKSESEKIQSCLADIKNSSAKKLEDLLGDGISQICNKSLSPKFKSMAEAMSGYTLSEEDLAAQDTGSPFITDFIAQMRQMLCGYEASLLPGPYETLVATLTDDIVKQLERAIFKHQFNKCGAIQFDVDLRILSGYISSLTQWSSRDKFVRLDQIAQLLCSESLKEAQECCKDSQVWRLTSTEIKNTLALRREFSNGDIEALTI
eukprot:m.35467 g.35467  ORF g.35467 m.35467 type:complete len:705 (+) comp8884_c0_seq3:93-2207(+)